MMDIVIESFNSRRNMKHFGMNMIFKVFSAIWIRRYGVIMGSMLMYRFMNCTKSG